LVQLWKNVVVQKRLEELMLLRRKGWIFQVAGLAGNDSHKVLDKNPGFLGSAFYKQHLIAWDLAGEEMSWDGLAELRT
jgi:hypothetical protein